MSGLSKPVLRKMLFINEYCLDPAQQLLFIFIQHCCDETEIQTSDRSVAIVPSRYTTLLYSGVVWFELKCEQQLLATLHL